jgi:hypothetical protein
MATGNKRAKGAALIFEDTAKPRAIPNPKDNDKIGSLKNCLYLLVEIFGDSLSTIESSSFSADFFDNPFNDSAA